MTKSTKKQYSSAEKAKIALEAIKGELTISQISSKYGVHATQINNWRKIALESIVAGFSIKCKGDGNTSNDEELINKLYQQIGQLSTECEWLKKKSVLFKY